MSEAELTKKMGGLSLHPDTTPLGKIPNLGTIADTINSTTDMYGTSMESRE